MLRKAGCISTSGKGNHTLWSHPLLRDKLTPSGKDTQDAKPDQEKDARNYLREKVSITNLLEA